MASLHPRRRNLSNAEPVPPSLQFEAVEPRVLFSATAIDPVEPAVSGHHDLPQVQDEIVIEVSAPSRSDESGSHPEEDQIIGGLNYRAADLDATERRELVFVSGGLFDDGYLAQHLDPAYEVYLIEPGSDAIQQIADVVEGRSGIDAIHLIGHGEEGRLFLGETALDSASMSGTHGMLLGQIGASLSDRADLLIYGCDFSNGDDGAAAAELLASLTGADVSTSSDKTGHADLGGDWDLEVSTGEIEAATIVMADWHGLLAPPTITAPSGELSTLEDAPLTFSGPNLIAVGSDVYPTLSVTLSVGQGALNLSGTSGITFLGGTQNGDALLEISGTVANLNSALNGLIFTPAQDVFGPETLSISVDDGDDVTSRDLAISVVSQNDAPVITVNPVNASATGTPSETAPHTFTLADFEAVDPDNTNNQLTFILNALPSVGELRLNGLPVAVGTVFTQSMLDAGALVYIHNGGETHSDSFTLTVNDGAGGTDPLVVIPITITPVNDSMTVVTQAVVYEGGSTSDGAIAPGKPVPVLSLNISDAEADSKTVRITSLPGGGTLYFNGVPITQMMVDGGYTFDAGDFALLEYRHDGIDDLGTSPSDRSFTIQVTDLGGGAGVAGIQTVNHTVNIDVVPVNDDLELVTLSVAVPTITSGNSYVLGLTDMEVNDPDGPNPQLTYTLQSSPLLGDLYINGQLSGAGATFTQAQLAAGLVVFTNGGANGPDSLFFTVTDSQVSILTDELGTLRTGDYTTPQRVLELRFNLTASGGGGSVIRLDEGQSAPVNIANPGEVIELTSLPAHGQILVNGIPLGVGSPYLVQPGDAITYAHDGSHIDSDLINLEINSVPGVVDVIVRLTNDAPVLTILSTVTGIHEGSSGTITTAHLSVTDEETSDPALLVYTVIGSPASGSILKDGNVLPAFGTFSHQDVIDGRITYEHNGDEHFLDSVQLRVSDGSATDTGTLSIAITPVNDQPNVTVSFLELMEGATKSFTAAELGVSDVDGVGDDIGLSPDGPMQIRIDSLPVHGTLIYNDPINGPTPVTAGFVFDHSEIGRLSYQHDGSENFDDNFDFTVLDNNTYNNPGFDAPGTRAGVMTIGIIPVNDAPAVTTNTGLVNDLAGDRRVYEGGTRVITPAVLGSSDPDSTDEQVQYRITSAPANGTLLLNGSPIGAGSAFSQDDLFAGRVTYRHNGSETSADQFNFRIDDGSSNVAEETFLIGIIAVNDAPTIAAPATATVNTADYHFTGGRAIGIADSDAYTGDVTVTLTVSDPGGLLRVTSTTGLTSVVGNDTSNVLVLVGDVSEINAALATLHYRATDLDGAATLTINVNDGGNTGVDPSQVPFGEITGLVDTGTIMDEQANRVVNLLVSPIDDAPVNSVPGAQTAYEDVNFIFSSANGNAITISDVDAFGGEMQVTLSVGNGNLTLATTAGLTFTAGDGTSDATMTFRGTVSAINAAIEGLRYRGNNNFEGGEILTITTNDLGNTGDGGPLSDTDTVGITVIGVNDAPTISGPSGNILINSASFTFNGGNAISVSDTDIASGLATVTLTVNDAGGILTITELTGLSAISGNGTSNVLTFTGTLTDVNNALATLSYAPDDVDGSATLTVLVSDNGNTGIDPSTIGLSHTGTVTDEQASRVFNLTVSDINDAPVNTVPTAQTFNEDTTRVFSTGNGNALAIADVDAFGFDVTTTITVNNGVLTAGGTAPQRAALTSLTGNGTNTLVLTGTVTEINAVLQGLSYTGTLNFNGTDTLTITTNDNGNTGAGGPLNDVDTVTLNVSAVNDAPVNTVPAAQNVNEDTALVFSSGNGNLISVSDVDATEGTGLLTVTVGVTNGTLTLNGTAGLSFGAGDGTGDTTMTFTGTAASINAALNGLTFNPVADYNGPALLSLSTSDNGNFGSGGTQVTNSSVNITVNPIADITIDTVSTQEDVAVTFDVIAGTNGATADNFEGSPIITMINTTAVTLGSVVNVSNGTVTVDAVTGLLTFTPSLNYNGTTSFTYTVSSPTGVTETAQVNVNVTPVNDAPVNTVPAAQTFNEDTTRVFSTANGNALAIADVDAASGDVTTTISVSNGTLTAGGTAPQRAALTSLTGNGTNTLVLTGTVTEINAVLQGLSYTGTLNFNGTDTLTITTNDNGNTGAGGPLNDVDTVTLNVSAVNDAPVNTVPAAQNVNEDTALVFSSGNGNLISVSDVDATEGTGLLTVTVGVTNGTLTLNGTAGLSFGAGDGTGDTTMTFTGTAASINAALNGLTFNPVADYNGPALLSLSTSDNGNFGSGGAQVTNSSVNITVNPIADITIDTVSTQEDVAVTFDVIAGTNGATADNFEGSPIITMINTTAVTLGSVVNVSNGTVTVDAVTGLLTFTPSLNYNGTTSFTYTVSSPTGVTETAQVNVNVTPVNDAPVNTVPTAQTFNEDTTRVFSTGNGNALAIADVDAFGFDVTTTITVNNGVLTAGGTAPQRAALTSLTGNGTNTLVLTGTVTEINAVLQGLSYTGTLNFNGTDTLTITTNDNGNTGAGGPLNDVDTVTLNVSAVNDAPVNTVPAAQNVNEDTALVFSSGNGNLISVSDVDATEGTGLLTVTVGVTNGTLTLNGTAGLSFGAGDGTGDTTMTFTGTAASINAALNGLTFNPVADYNGPALLSLSTSDNGNFGSGGTQVTNSSVNITVNPIADITIDTVSTQEDVAVTFDVIAGTNGATADNFEGSPIITMINTTAVTLGSVVNVSNGTVTVDAVTGLLTFTPSLNYNGTTSFTYTVTSPAGVTETAQVNVNVGGDNDAPVNVVPLAQNVNEDATLIFSTANGNAISVTDIDAATGLMTVTLSVTNGTLTLNGTTGLAFITGDGSGDTTMTFSGTLTNINAALNGLAFNPVADYNGPAQLSIATNDNGNTGVGGSLTDNDTVNITVNPVVDITPDTVSTQEDVNVTFNVITGTNGATADTFEGTPVLTAINGTPVIAGSAIAVSNGTVTVDATTGLLTFDPDAEFNGSTSFQYTVTSPTGITETALVTVNVGAVNDAPVNTVPGAQNLNEDATLVFSGATGNAISVSDLDAAEGSGLLTVTLGVTNGVLTLNGTMGLVFSQGDGTGDATMTFIGTAADINAALDGLVFTPVADYNGPALLTITTNDNGNNGSGGALSDLDTVAITVSPVVDITDDFVNTDEDTAITFHVIAGTNGATPDNFEGAPAVSAINGTSVTAGSIVDVGNGTVTVDATTGLLTFQPDPDFHGDVTFNYTVTSPAGVTETASVTVQVAPVNDDPFPVGTISDRSNDDSDVVSVDVSGFFDDVDLGDVLTFSATNLPAGLTIDPATGLISGTIDSSASVGGPYNVIITADDGNGGTTTQGFIWSVSNPLPTAVDDEFTATQDDSAIVVGNAITNNDTDPDGDALTAIVQSDVAGSNGGRFSIDSNGNVTFDPNGDFADLLGGETRQTTFSYTIVDADGATSTATVTVTVLGVNEPPVPVSGKIEVSIGSRGGKLGLSAPVDPDGDPLTITVSQLPKKGILRLANGTPVKVGQVLTAKQLESLVFDAPARYTSKKPVKFLYSVSDGQYVSTAKVDITIVQSNSCFLSLPASFKGATKKVKG